MIRKVLWVKSLALSTGCSLLWSDPYLCWELSIIDNKQLQEKGLVMFTDLTRTGIPIVLGVVVNNPHHKLVDESRWFQHSVVSTYASKVKSDIWIDWHLQKCQCQSGLWTGPDYFTWVLTRQMLSASWGNPECNVNCLCWYHDWMWLLYTYIAIYVA